MDPPAAATAGPGADDGGPDLAEALEALREEDAELLRLWAWEQLTPAEIAAVLDITPNAASIRLAPGPREAPRGLRKTGAVAGHEESNERRRT